MDVGQTTLSVLLMVQWNFFGKNNVAQHVNLVFLTVLMALQARSKISYLKVMIWRFTIKFSIQHCVLAFSAWQVSFPILLTFSLSLSLSWINYENIVIYVWLSAVIGLSWFDLLFFFKWGEVIGWIVHVNLFSPVFAVWFHFNCPIR